MLWQELWTTARAADAVIVDWLLFVIQEKYDAPYWIPVFAQVADGKIYNELLRTGKISGGAPWKIVIFAQKYAKINNQNLENCPKTEPQIAKHLRNVLESRDISKSQRRHANKICGGGRPVGCNGTQFYPQATPNKSKKILLTVQRGSFSNDNMR